MPLAAACKSYFGFNNTVKINLPRQFTISVSVQLAEQFCLAFEQVCQLLRNTILVKLMFTTMWGELDTVKNILADNQISNFV